MNRTIKRVSLFTLPIALIVGLAIAGVLAKQVEPQKKGAAMSKAQKPSPEVLKKKLTPLQYRVTQEEGTEPPFRNEYWDNKEPGIYVDVVTGEPLFSSLDKFASGTGWPSFTRPIDKAHIVSRTDHQLFVARTEVRSRQGDSHLGHVFDDGPGPTGQRYCINSAALRFVPVSRLEAEGYGQYLPLFRGGAGAAKEKKMSEQSTKHKEIATLAGGCFWGVEELLRKLPGVLESTVGYTGGTLPRPSYEQVSTGKTGHAEAVQVVFDPRVLSYEEVLRYFFRLHDPTTPNRQGHDVGTQYRSAIFYHSPAQEKIAERVRAEVARSGKWKDKIVTEIVPATAFFTAESYHQDYLQQHPHGYTCHYLRD